MVDPRLVASVEIATHVQNGSYLKIQFTGYGFPTGAQYLCGVKGRGATGGQVGLMSNGTPTPSPDMIVTGHADITVPDNYLDGDQFVIYGAAGGVEVDLTVKLNPVPLGQSLGSTLQPYAVFDSLVVNPPPNQPPANPPPQSDNGNGKGLLALLAGILAFFGLTR